MYKYLSLMSNNEIRALLINYGNNTGAEINNYVIRQLIKLKESGEDHPVLNKMNEHIRISSVDAVTSDVRQYIKDFNRTISEESLIKIIRENKNSIYLNESIEAGHKSFSGLCVHHGNTLFSIRRGKYFCYECLDEKQNNILYNPTRNLILKSFVDHYGISVSDVVKELNINSIHVYKHYKALMPISDNTWELISNLIKKVESNVNSNKTQAV